MDTTLEFKSPTQEYFDTTVNNIPNPEEILSVTIYRGEITNLRCLSRLCNLQTLSIWKKSGFGSRTPS